MNILSLSHQSRPTLYFENNLGSINAHPAGYAQLTYHDGKHTLEDHRTMLQHTGDLLQNRRWHRLLEDQQHLVPLTTEQQELTMAYWQRQAQVLARSLCVATVLAQNVFTRLASATQRQELKATDINYRLFSDAPAANSWLQKQAGCAPLRA